MEIIQRLENEIRRLQGKIGFGAEHKRQDLTERLGAYRVCKIEGHEFDWGLCVRCGFTHHYLDSFSKELKRD